MPEVGAWPAGTGPVRWYRARAGPAGRGGGPPDRSADQLAVQVTPVGSPLVPVQVAWKPSSAEAPGCRVPL
ncbi:hypothetical protein Sru01_08620 [Sphaerisporangium rufum]|uniref:Uncharacterized protein n=1 Tax=Sphaerisporangium rufum TaxID=1381558 RepID=A0A919QZX7_9ACTN|nr:hypothetical protein Sru01_08620 [Sphaerisporangium rufum]